MRVALIVCCAVVSALNVGCMLPVPIIRWRADSVLTVEPSRGSEVTMGLRESCFRTTADAFVLEALGLMPMEHETHWDVLLVGTTAHPYPDYFRLVRITCRGALDAAEPRECRVQLLMQAGWPARARATFYEPYEAYDGTALLRFESRVDTVSTELIGVRLARVGAPEQTLCVSGEVVVKQPKDNRAFPARLNEMFDEHWREATEGPIE